MAKVKFEASNAAKCICMQCPVQVKSACAIGKVSPSDPPKDSLPKGLPKVYCAKGLAECKDIDGKASCICGSCEVWKTNKLVKGKPAYHFCIHGPSS